MQWYWDRTNPIKSVASRAIAATSDDSEDVFNLLPEGTRHQIIVDIFKEVDRISAADDQVRANRKFFVESMLDTSHIIVMLITPDDSWGGDLKDWLLDQPGVSGALRDHMAAIVRADKLLREHFYAADVNIEQLSNHEAFDGCAALYSVARLKLHVSNVIRRYLGDCNENPERDWYRPFLHAMCVWDEHQYRRAINLPPALEGAESELDALGYSIFMNLVLDGERNPHRAWNELHAR